MLFRSLDVGLYGCANAIVFGVLCIAQVDILKQLILQKDGGFWVFVAMIAGAFGKGRDKGMGEALEVFVGVLIGEVEDNQAGLHLANAVMVFDQPQVRVCMALGVGPHSGVLWVFLGRVLLCL